MLKLAEPITKQDRRCNRVSGNHDENKPLTRAEMKRGHLATQHRILNVLIVLASIAAVYLVIKTIF